MAATMTRQLTLGDTVTFYNPGDSREHESWTRGVIRATTACHKDGAYAVHIVRINGFKWDREAEWSMYDGVPECLGREVNGKTELEFIDTWPRRNF